MIATGGQRERPQRLNLDDVADAALARRGGQQPLQQRECRAGTVLGEQHARQQQIPRRPRVIRLVLGAKASRLRPLAGRRDITLGQQQPRPLRGHRVEQGDHLRAQLDLPGLAHRRYSGGRIAVRLPDPGQDDQPGGQRQGEGQLAGIA